MKKVIIAALVLVAIGLITVNVLKYTRNQSSLQSSIAVQTYRVVKQELKRSVIASGIAVPVQEEKIMLQSELGEFERFLVTEGQRITAGAPVLRYRTEEVEKQLEELAVSRKRLELQMEDVQSKLSNIVPDFRNELENGNAIDQPEKIVKETARKQQDLERQLKTISIDFEANESQKAGLEQKRERQVVRSRISGIVERVNQPTNGTSEQPLVHLISDDRYQIRGLLSEFDYLLVKPGQHVEVKLKVLKGTTYKGVVEQVDSIPDGAGQGNLNGSANKEAVTLYPFTVTLLEQSSELKYGYHVYIDIDVQSQGERVAIPHQAVLTENGNDFVLLVVNGRIHKQQITVGDSNDSWKEVRSGAAEGDTIVSNPKTDMKEGTLVQSESGQ